MRTMTLMMVLVVTAACGEGGGGGTDGGGGGVEANWPSIQSEVIAGCAGAACHGTGNTTGQFVLAPDVAYANTVGVASTDIPAMNLIEPGDSQSSYLFRKLEGTHGAACTDAGEPATACGSRMPRGGTPLPQTTLDAIDEWITAGASEN